jgi:hypothetical protein
LVRILRVKPAGTQSGGTGQIKAAPGITTPAKAGNTTMQQMAIARRRVLAWRKMGGSIGSKGGL